MAFEVVYGEVCDWMRRCPDNDFEEDFKAAEAIDNDRKAILFLNLYCAIAKWMEEKKSPTPLVPLRSNFAESSCDR